MQLGSVPLLNKLGIVKEVGPVKKTREVLEDLREKYETTDHPAVHKVRLAARPLSLLQLPGQVSSCRNSQAQGGP